MSYLLAEVSVAVEDAEEAAGHILLYHLKGAEGVLVDVLLALSNDLPRVHILHLVLGLAAVFFAAAVLVLLVLLASVLVFLAPAQIPAEG